MIDAAARGPRPTGACQANWMQQTPPFLQEVALNKQVSPERFSGRGEMA